MPISDTTPEAAAIRRRILQAMTGEQRLRLGLEMSAFAHRLTKGGIPSDHPEWSNAEVMTEFVRRTLLPPPAMDRW
ncbi:MAG: hypothetical protein ABSD20_18400 [Terriglobales bacterium]